MSESTPVQLGVKPRPRPQPGERCDLCGEPIGGEHPHLVNLRSRALMCGCRSCYFLFTSPGAGGGFVRAVPERYEAVAGFSLDAGGWDALQIPVGVTFFFHNSAVDRTVACYPGPAGAAESLLPLDAWQGVVDAHPALATVRPDVEAVLVRAGRAAGAVAPEAFIVPIDACYELVGVLRATWHGFDGGPEAEAALARFFAGLRQLAGVGDG